MLTDITIQKLPTPAKRVETPDGKVTGLYLIRQPSGARSWAVRYRAHGKPSKLTLGPYPAVPLGLARRRALEALGAIAGGSDPRAGKKAAREAARAQHDLVESVVEMFIKRHAARENTRYETARLLRREVVGAWRGRRLSAIRRPDVHDLLDRIVDRNAPIVANRTLAALRQLCSWAIDRGLIETSPCDRIKAPAAETARDRVLSDEEIRLVWGRFDAIGWPFGTIGKLLLLTGMRRSEVAEATWSEIDLDARTWTLPKDRTKNGVEHQIPLSEPALEILRALPRIEAGRRPAGFLFSLNGQTPVSGFARVKAAIDAELGDGVAPWTLHDLRRTTASGMAGIGIAPHVVEAVLNHKSGTIRGVAAVYNKYNYATEKRQALEAWSRRLASIVHGGVDNVVEIAARR